MIVDKGTLGQIDFEPFDRSREDAPLRLAHTLDPGDRNGVQEIAKVQGVGGPVLGHRAAIGDEAGLEPSLSELA
jgi:hypothetical protein